jgi:hypothetical protein
MAYITRYLFAFVLTLVTELVVAVPILAPGGSRWRRAGAVTVAQLATHPSVWFFWPLFGWQRSVYLLVAEGFALVTELLIYRLMFQKLPWSRALAASALANGASVLLGVWLQ